MTAMIGAACSPLLTFDMLVPKDDGGVKVASDISYGEGTRQKLDIYAPRHAAAEARLPIILFFYGGSWASGTRNGYAFVGRALAAQGFLVIIPDYRVGPANLYPDFVKDGASVIRWIVAHGREHGGEPTNIVVSGHSAGAYIAAMLAVDDRWLGKDRIAIKGLVGIAGPYDFAPFDVPASKAAFGAWPKPADTQPVRWAGAGDPPTLLLIGGSDVTVRARNSEALAAKLRAGGVAVQVKRYPGIGHIGMVTAMARPFRYRASIITDTVKFAQRVTGVN
ncbi:carboxylesterase (plasmid) [Sphingobium sp. TKS]|uniref:Carboxylesterase family protein n=2 Tax=Sphingomonadaceae TaxID=41297 RepID=A0A0D4ZYF3_9SPHN|nr:carboxylesterase family protein [Sphingomonas sp. NS2]AMK26624.1 carboxylesterase [Sphingobium sp. TKS]